MREWWSTGHVLTNGSYFYYDYKEAGQERGLARGHTTDERHILS